MSGSGISWAICKSAPCSRQITMPAPHHSVFYRPDALPAAQPTASKHWSHIVNCDNFSILNARASGNMPQHSAVLWPFLCCFVPSAQQTSASHEEIVDIRFFLPPTQFCRWLDVTKFYLSAFRLQLFELNESVYWKCQALMSQKHLVAFYASYVD